MDNGRTIVNICEMHRLGYFWGVLFIAFLVLFVSSFLTHNAADETSPRYHFYVPLWVSFVPLLFGFVYTYAMTQMGSSDLAWKTEKLEFSLSDMNKKEYLNFKVGDDRTNKNFLASLTSASILSGSALLGPFLRGDR